MVHLSATRWGWGPLTVGQGILTEMRSHANRCEPSPPRQAVDHNRFYVHFVAPDPEYKV
jgi:hypothetical protein